MAGIRIGDTEEPWAKVPSILPTPGSGFERGIPTAPKQSLEWTPQQRAEQMAGGSLGAEPPMMGVPVAKTAPTVSVSAPVNRTPVYENSVIQGRATLNNPVTGPITAAAAPVGVAAGGTMPAPMIGNGPISNGATVDPMVAIRAELASRRAQEAMDQQGKNQAMAANANWASNWTAQRDAANNARVANWNAEMARTDLAGNIGGPGRDEAARLATLTASGANNQLATADANLQKSQAGLTGSPRNYIDEFGKLQTADKERMNAQSLQTTAGSRVTEANARATEAAAKSELERAQAIGITLNNDQHRKILDLSSKMITGTPDEAAKAERSIRTLLGKNSDRYDIKALGGGSVVNASGFPEVQPQTLAIVDKETGQAVEFRAGGGAGGSFRKPSEDAVAQAKKIGDTPANRAALLANYGPEETKRILGK